MRVSNQIDQKEFKAALKKVGNLADVFYRATLITRYGVDLIEVRNTMKGFRMYFDTCENFLKWEKDLS